MYEIARRKHALCIVGLISVALVVSSAFQSGAMTCCFPHTKNLPPPLDIDMPLEEAICRRMSVREFTGHDISEEMLSTVLWAAFGTAIENRTISDIAAVYGIRVYVLTSEGVYTYAGTNHSLTLFQQGDYRWIGQYDTAAVKLGLVWDQQACSDENIASAVIGEIGQNVYFVTNALGLGTVTTASEVGQLRLIGIPQHEVPKIIMPIGHPTQSYDFTYSPSEGELPNIRISSASVSAAINQRRQSIAWQGTLFNWQQTQLMWAAYGFSYFLDATGGRHRTVPSSHGTYPLRLFAVNATGIYEYVPEDHMLKPRCLGDFRQAVGTASRNFIAAAPLLIVPVLNTSMVDEQFLWPWYYEGGAVAHNVLLEASAWNLSATIISALNHSSLNQILKLDSEYLPLLVIPTGRAQEIVDDAPPTITLTQPVKNTLFVFGKPIMPLPREEAVIIGSLTARATGHDDYALQVMHWYIDGESAGLQQQPPYDLSLPVSLPLRIHTLTIKGHDYANNPATVTIPYIKLG